MSTTQILEPGAETPLSGWSEAHGDFDYRPMPALVSVAGAFAFFSLTSFVMDWLLLVPAVGILLSLVAVWQIRKNRAAYSGQVAATMLALVMGMELAGASALHAYTYATEVPEGFQRISFSSDISKYELKTVDGAVQIPEPVQALDSQPVFLKGYMYPEKEEHGKTRFVLCKDMDECCFGGNPKPTDMIVIEMENHKTVDHRTGLVSVAGTFRTNADLGATGLNPVYKLDCSYFSTAKTSH